MTVERSNPDNIKLVFGVHPTSIAGTHYGTIKPNHTVIATKLYTYPCEGTGGHTEYVRIWNDTWADNTLLRMAHASIAHRSLTQTEKHTRTGFPQ
ncbi:MAG: hypothetical protein J7I99_02835 [Methanophagales archaeon]|nr:hypothetical protein [Methanophagales archaeon]